MADGELFMGAPVALGLLYWGRKTLEIPARLPTYDRWLQRLWIPAVMVMCLGLGGIGKAAEWLDQLFLTGALAFGMFLCWQIRAYRPALWVLVGLAPVVAYLTLDLLLPLALGSLQWLDMVGVFTYWWLGAMLLVARSQQKALTAELNRRQQAEQEQRAVEGQTHTLEYEVNQRTAALSRQTDALRATLAELQATQDQLVQREKMASLGELTAGIAHEIQNPLNFVNNFADVSAELVQELAEERARPARDAALEAELLADLRQNLQRISQHGQRAAGIVRGMLAHSRQGSGERQAVDVNALADEYLRLAYHGLRAKDKTFNATLDTTFAPYMPKVEAVPGDLGRVLLNLFTNAFYAVQKRQQQGEAGYQPTVRVRTRCVSEIVEIQVSDNGTGIPAEVQQKIFQPFFTTKPSGEGTGLGLSLAHDIVVQGHGGTLAVASQVEEGTTFTVQLPR